MKHTVVWRALLLAINLVTIVVQMTLGADLYMRPYKDTMIMMTHGINADRYSWVEKDTEGDIKKDSNKTDLWWHYVNKELGVQDSHIKAYSFSARSGWHEANMLEFGYRGYDNPASGAVETNGVVTQDSVKLIKLGGPFGKQFWRNTLNTIEC